MGCHFLLQGVFPTQGLNPRFLHWQADSLLPYHLGSSNVGGQVANQKPTEVHLTLITAATAKSLQSCPTLCNPIDGSPPGSPVPGILQARTLEWVAISFSITPIRTPAIKEQTITCWQ